MANKRPTTREAIRTLLAALRAEDRVMADPGNPKHRNALSAARMARMNAALAFLSDGRLDHDTAFVRAMLDSSAFWVTSCDSWLAIGAEEQEGVGT